MMSREITGHTTLTALLGSPVGNSISPAMHNAGFEALGLDYVYLAFDVGTEGLARAVDGMKVLGVRGFNLTMPDKNLMCELCDRLSPAAELAGAVNTVLNEDGVLTGYMTDGVGYMRSVKEAGYDIIGGKMTLLGAGGAATAIMLQAALDGVAEISVFNSRSPRFERAERIIGQLKEVCPCQLHLYDFSDPAVLKKEIASSDILVNGTSVGMAPNTEDCVIKDPSVFMPGLIVSDVIYNPRETRLLRMAKQAGCHTFNGMYMLLYQGAEAFKIWTGHEMPVEMIKERYFSEKE